MPQINIYVARALDAQIENSLQKKISECITILPGKTKESLMICISDGLRMYKNGDIIDGVFVDIRIFQNTTEEGKRELTKKIFDIARDTLGIPSNAMNVNFTELQDWGSAGLYKTVKNSNPIA